MGTRSGVGATQDLLSLNVDLASVMREGRWTTVRMPIRYGEGVMAARGGMARAAKEQGREQERVCFSFRYSCYMRAPSPK